MNKGLKTFQLFFKLIIVLLPVAAHAVTLIEGEDYNYGNGRGAPVAELVAGYAHKDDALDYFTQRRASAVRRLYEEKKLSPDGWPVEDALPDDLEERLKGNYDSLSMDPRYARGIGERVRFFTLSGLEKCQVFLINKKFYHYDESGTLVLYNSGGETLDGRTGDIIVMDRQGNIFIHPKVFGLIHHSSFFSQKPISFGAMVRVKDGELVNADLTKDELDSVDLDPTRVEGTDYPKGLMYYSGHYNPHSGSTEIKDQIKRNALDSFKQELAMIHFEAVKQIKSRPQWEEMPRDTMYFMTMYDGGEKVIGCNGNDRLHVLQEHVPHERPIRSSKFKIRFLPTPDSSISLYFIGVERYLTCGNLRRGDNDYIGAKEGCCLPRKKPYEPRREEFIPVFNEDGSFHLLTEADKGWRYTICKSKPGCRCVQRPRRGEISSYPRARFNVYALSP